MTTEPTHLMDMALLAIIAAATGVVADLPSDVTLSVFDDSHLRIYCLIGALGGAWTTVELFSKATATRKERASKMFISSIVSILFSPAIFNWLNLPRSSDYLMGISGVVAIIGVAVIQGVYGKAVAYGIRRLSPPDDNPSSDSTPEANKPTNQP